MSALRGQKGEISVTETQRGPSQASTVMKQEPVSLNSTEAPIPNQNGTNGQGSGVIDLTKPIKTDAEASMAVSSFISRSLQLTPTSSPAISSPITPFAPNLGSLSSQLTPDEQTAAYKKANILALSALAKKGGPNTKDIFAAQQKLQEFLTSLITLAGQKGPQLKVTVQMLVQNLVTGQISEEEFATRIESDLRSKHQPSLLPFLKDSVPHLKARLQLQQVIMKELLQKMIAEKRNNISPATVAASTSTQEVSPNPPLTATQSVTAVQVAPMSSSSSPSAKTAAGAGAKVTVGTMMSNSSSGQQLQLPPTFSQAAFESLSQQLPKVLRDKIIKLPKEQQKFVYMHQLRQMQQLQGQQRQSQQGQQRQPKPLVASPKVVLEKQQRLVQEQQVPIVVGAAKGSVRGVASTASVGSGTADGKGKANFASMKIVPGGSPGSSAGGSKRKGRSKDAGPDIADEEEEVVGMDLLDEVGVNLQEETAQFLPQALAGTTTTARSCKDTVFLNLPNLRRRVETIMRANGVQEGVGEEALVLLSHATQERMKDVVEKLTEISQHRVQVLKEDSNYHVKSEVRGQLRVLEAIDRIASKRKQEKEHEQMLKAAKSRSKGADPEKAAKIREEAKQLQLDEAARIRNERANQTALAAIGRKRAFPAGGEDSGGGGGSSADGGNNSAMTSSLFAPLASTRSPKRHMTIRDLIFYMEQERETRKSLALYRALMK